MESHRLESRAQLTQWGAGSRASTSMIRVDENLVVLDICCAIPEVFIVPVGAIVGHPLAQTVRPGFMDAVERVLGTLQGAAASGQSEVGIEWADDGLLGVWEVVGYRLSDRTSVVLIRDFTELVQIRDREQAYMQKLRSVALDSSDIALEERRLLAIELHDRVSQPLAAARLRLQEHARLHSREDLAVRDEQHRQVLELIDAAIVESRAITSELAPVVYYELGLYSALLALAEDCQRMYGFGVEITYTAPDPLGVKDGTIAFLYRASRELVSNAMKHSGTNRVELALCAGDGQVSLTVRDHGKGFDLGALAPYDPLSAGFGLFTLRERVETLGGGLDVASAPGRGSCVVLTVPVG